MKTKDSLLSVFLLMLIFIVILYGFYELGGCYMCLGYKITAFVFFCLLVVALIIGWGISIFSNVNACNSNIMYISSGEVYVNSKKVENVFIISDEKDVVQNGKKNIVVLKNVTLKKSMFAENENSFKKNIENIKNIYFLSEKPSIESELYESIKKKIKYISSDKQILQIVFVDSKNNK